jgi:hypothetical protein
MSAQLLAALAGLSSYSEASTNGLVPDGVYEIKLDEASVVPKDDGRVFLKFVGLVTTGTHAGRKVVKNIVVADNAAGVLKGWCHAVLGAAPSTAPEIAAALPQFIDKLVRVRVKRDAQGNTMVTPYA